MNNQLIRKTCEIIKASSISPSDFSKIEINKLYDIFMNGRCEAIYLNWLHENNLKDLLEKNKLKNLRDFSLRRINHTKNINFHLSKLYDDLHVWKIKCIILKGSFLIDTCYDLNGTRTLRDIDLLVKKEDIPKLVNFLSKEGYKFKRFNSRLPEKVSYKGRYDIEPMINDYGVCIEIHHRISKEENCKFTNKFFQDSLEYHFKNKKYFSLSPECHLLHIIYHGTSKQGFDVGVQAIIDIFNILNHFEINFSKLFSLAKDFDINPELTLVLQAFTRHQLYDYDGNFKKNFNNEELDLFMNLMIFNSSNQHSVKIYQNKLIKILKRNFSLKTAKEDYYAKQKMSELFTSIVRRIIKNTLVTFQIIKKSIFEKEFREDNKKTIQMLKIIENAKINN